jgi:hypothetical protein
MSSGKVNLAEGVTAAVLDQARLLGVVPFMNGVTVDVKSSFEVSDVTVTETSVALAVTIAVEKGALPGSFKLGGEVKLSVCQTLGGGWTEITPDPSDIVVKRVSDTEATVSVTYDHRKHGYQFFKMIVK